MNTWISDYKPVLYSLLFRTYAVFQIGAPESADVTYALLPQVPVREDHVLGTRVVYAGEVRVTLLVRHQTHPDPDRLTTDLCTRGRSMY